MTEKQAGLAARGGECGTEAETGVMRPWSRSANSHQQPEEAEPRFSLRPSRGGVAWPAPGFPMSVLQHGQRM